MRQVILTLAALAVLGAVAGAATIGLGLFNVSARIDHLPPVHWALHTTFEQNVRLRAPDPAAVPATLEDPGMIRLGAGHYDSACRFCHAAPGEAQSATVRAMNPVPPHITEAAAKWQPHHLHWIIDNGVKMSGMPHWPSRARDDDVWAVVAFLAQVPGMTAQDYDGLLPRVADRPAGLAYCATCHGADGRGGGNPHVPRLDIQGAPYLEAALEAYRQGRRDSGIMHHAARAVEPALLPGLAAHFASRDPGAAPAPAPPGPPGTEACRACHGPWPEPRNPLFPELAGQHAAYTATQLRLWRDGLRAASTPQEALMKKAAHALEDADIDAIAAWYAALPAAPDG
ncbi:c-type cytochrome [Mangrovicoccus algicola]|uniref:C-type cytochrome n=1 Tax=Mangrovicoccus algicola TaxID=2771008 RepID=A0A8J6YTP0_9RHOB|nr:c-type cytochrome [Mangrovicoccus algicola]MBE3637622.1 c-type cytochrome [Mangrovicoccus algicola]